MGAAVGHKALDGVEALRERREASDSVRLTLPQSLIFGQFKRGWLKF